MEINAYPTSLDIYESHYICENDLGIGTQYSIDSGVAQFHINDWDAYKTELRKRLGLDNRFLRSLTLRAKQNPQRVVFAEADNPKILKAAHNAKEEGSCIPILLGFEDYIKTQIEERERKKKIYIYI